MVTDLSEIYSIHFNQCRKPWNCIGKGSKAGTFGKTAIPEDQVHLDHCMRLLKVWHDIRWDLESSLLKLTGDKSIDNGSKGDYKKDIFRGHCSGYGGENYLPIAGSVVTRRKISELYINVYR